MNEKGINQIAAILILCVCGVGGALGIYYTSQAMEEADQALLVVRTDSNQQLMQVATTETVITVGSDYGFEATAPANWTVKESVSQSDDQQYTAIFEDEDSAKNIVISTWDKAMEELLQESMSSAANGEDITVDGRQAIKTIRTSLKDGSPMTVVVVFGEKRLINIVTNTPGPVFDTFLANLNILP